MAVMDKDMGKLLNYKKLMSSPEYKKSMEPFISQQIQAIGKWHWRSHKKTANTIEFIFQHKVPTETMKGITYRQFFCTVRPKKVKSNQMQFTVGEDRINYPGKVATPTTEMLVAKMVFNSMIFTKGAHLMTMDINNFYLMTPLHCPEFIWNKLSYIPDEIVKEYKLKRKPQKWQHLHKSQAWHVRPTTSKAIGQWTPQKNI